MTTFTASTFVKSPLALGADQILPRSSRALLVSRPSLPKAQSVPARYVQSSRRAFPVVASWHQSSVGNHQEKSEGLPVVRSTMVAGMAAATLVLMGVQPEVSLAQSAQTTANGAVQTNTTMTLFDRGVERCTMEQLKKGAETRAGFSDFAGEPELLVNIEGCDYSGKDLSNDVMSGVKARGANFAGAVFGRESSRADYRGADMRGAVFPSTNLYETRFNGADLRGATFDGALASSAKFGFDPETQQWANLEGTVFEDVLFSSSDIKNLCANPTILEDDRDLLGCK